MLCPCVRMASWVSVLSVYLLLRLRIIFHSFEGFVLWVIVASVFSHFCCLVALMAESISVFNVCILWMVSGVGFNFLCLLLSAISCFMWREKAGL